MKTRLRGQTLPRCAPICYACGEVHLGQSFLSQLFGSGKSSESSQAEAPKGRVSNRELQGAIQNAKDDPAGISEARLMLEQMKGQLSNADRVEAYRQLAAAPNYRNQRDNTKDPSSTCNFTSQAMAFEGLGQNFDEETKGKQGEEQLYDRFYKKGFGSRVEEKDRLKLARDQGFGASQLDTPAFGSAAEAKKWFDDNIKPALENGASATMGVKSGTFKHVVRVQWIEAKGVLIDDPWGASVGNTKGEFGYTKLNPEAEPGKKRTLDKDQAGDGNDRLIPWETIATVMSNRYVQLYTSSAKNQPQISPKT